MLGMELARLYTPGQTNRDSLSSHAWCAVSRGLSRLVTLRRACPCMWVEGGLAEVPWGTFGRTAGARYTSMSGHVSGGAGGKDGNRDR